MNTRRAFTATIPVLLLAALAACQSDEAAPSVSGAAGATTTTAAGGADTPSGSDAPVITDSPAVTDAAPVTAPDVTPAPPVMTPAPDMTVARPPAASVPGADPSTGLTAGAPAPAPDGITTDDSIKGAAMIAIDGPFPLALSGGLCSFVDSTLFIQAGSLGGGDGDFISLSYNTVNRSLAAIIDTSSITGELLQWESGGKTAMSLADNIDIIFDGAGISGSFAGIAAIAGPSTPTGKIDFGGRFSCTPAPFSIRGGHDLQLTQARCYGDQSYVSAGGATGDAALLAFDPSSLSAGDTSTSASLTFRIGTVQYTSIWALAEVDPDGLGATFRALMVGPDGAQFEVSGGFSCL